LFLEIDGAAPSTTDIHDEHHVKHHTNQIQLHRLAPFNQPRFIHMKAAARAKYAALMPESAIATNALGPCEIRNEIEIENDGAKISTLDAGRRKS
jgi:hypothetical protein